MGCSPTSAGVGEERCGGFSKQDGELRNRILGKRKKPESMATITGHHGGSKPRPFQAGSKVRSRNEGDSEDEGRSRVGKATKAENLMSQQASSAAQDPQWGTSAEVDSIAREEAPHVTEAPSAKIRSYLDEVLAQQAQKRKYKKKKRRRKQIQNSV